jgi:putative hemolysin
MSTLIVIVAVTTLMIFFNALYVAAEFSTVSARRGRVSQQAAAGNRLAALLLPIMTDTRRLDTHVAACQLGITASSLVLGFYGQAAIARELAPRLADLGGLQVAAAQSLAAVIVLIGLTVLQVVIGELVPKSIAIRTPEPVALLTIVPLRWSMALFRPAIALFNGTANLVLRLLRVPPSAGHMHVHSPDEIELLVTASAAAGLLDADERQLLRNAFQVGELTVAQVMVPRTRLVAAPLTTPVADLLDRATATGYSRLPLYRATIDDIAGIVHVKDLFRLHLAGESDAGGAVRAVPFVPESAPAIRVWNQLREQGAYVAVVLDEYGGTAGMITVEDLLEQVFGELQDEYDQEPALMAVDPDGRIRLHGEVGLIDLNRQLDLALPTDGAATIGGLVLTALERAPHVGDTVTFGATTVRVEAISGAVVREVSLDPSPVQEETGQGEASS